MPNELWLIRHGETAWSLSGAHTGTTDIPLTPEGEHRATAIGDRLHGHEFKLVLTSPMRRARDTCRLAGYSSQAQIDPNLMEWNYGDYEGLSTADIRKQRPDWFLWRDGVPNGETVDAVGLRAQMVIDRASQIDGAVALFAHGHVLRILAACWLGLPPVDGKLFALGTAAISVLGYERETRVISRWNT